MRLQTALLILILSLSEIAQASKHNVFVCKTGNRSIANGYYLFAYDEKGAITKGNRAGYCEITISADGKPFGEYWCWVADTETAKTEEGQLAILFKKSLGDGAYLYTQLNLPATLLEDKRGEGRYRTLSRHPKDLEKSLSQKEDVISCEEESVEFTE